MRRLGAALLTVLCFLAPAFGSDDHVRLDKPAVTVNIDWQNNMTGNDPVGVYVSRQDTGAFCTKVNTGYISITVPPKNCQGYFDTGNMCILQDDYVMQETKAMLNNGGHLCSVNEWDVTPSPAYITPLPTNQCSFALPSDATQRDVFGCTNPADICRGLGRPGSWKGNLQVKLVWDPHGNNGSDGDGGEATTNLAVTVNCLAPPQPQAQLTVSPKTLDVQIQPLNKIVLPNTLGQVQVTVTYTDAACMQPYQSVGIYRAGMFTTPGGPPPHNTLYLTNLYSNAPQGQCSFTSTYPIDVVSSQNQAQLLDACNDPQNSGKTLQRGMTILSHFCTNGACNDPQPTSYNASHGMTLNVHCPNTNISGPPPKSVPTGQPTGIVGQQSSSSASTGSTTSSIGSVPQQLQASGSTVSAQPVTQSVAQTQLINPTASSGSSSPTASSIGTVPQQLKASGTTVSAQPVTQSAAPSRSINPTATPVSSASTAATPASPGDVSGCSDYPSIGRFAGAIINDCSHKTHDQISIPTLDANGDEQDQPEEGEYFYTAYNAATNDVSMFEVYKALIARLQGSGFTIVNKAEAFHITAQNGSTWVTEDIYDGTPVGYIQKVLIVGQNP